MSNLHQIWERHALPVKGARMLAGLAAQSTRHPASFGTSVGATSLDVGTDAKLLGASSVALMAMQLMTSTAARRLTPAQGTNVHNKMPV